jgi:hypothetical protein
MRKLTKSRSGIADLRKTLRAKVMEARLGGVVEQMVTESGVNGAKKMTGEHVKWIVKARKGLGSTGGVYKAMQRLLKSVESSVTAADWLWDWIRTEQYHERICSDLQRGLQGADVRPAWRQELCYEVEGMWDKFNMTVSKAIEKRSGGNTLAIGSITEVAQSTKWVLGECRRAADVYRVALWNLALNRGLDVEGQGEQARVSGDWTNPLWWRLLQQEITPELREGVRITAERVLRLAKARLDTQRKERYLVHLCSGWGSGVEEAARNAGLGVLAVDIAADRIGKGVKWVGMDMTTVSWRWWREEIAACAGIKVCQMEAFWGGPPCTTMAKPDPSNKRKGKSSNYRDHGKDHRPPAHGAGTARGDEARQDDVIASSMIRMLMMQDKDWAMENPAAYLQAQTYMRAGGVERLKRHVSYCAYWEETDRRRKQAFQKHSNVWTNKLRWQPKGTTGTGRCKGHGKHDSLQDWKDMRVRCRVPRGLVAEWLGA